MKKLGEKGSSLSTIIMGSAIGAMLVVLIIVFVKHKGYLSKQEKMFANKDDINSIKKYLQKDGGRPMTTGVDSTVYSSSSFGTGSQPTDAGRKNEFRLPKWSNKSAMYENPFNSGGGRKSTANSSNWNPYPSEGLASPVYASASGIFTL